MIPSTPTRPPANRRALIVVIGVLMLAAILVLGYAVGAILLRSLHSRTVPTPTPSATVPTPTPSPTVDPAILIEFGVFDRTDLVQLPRPEEPGELPLATTHTDTGLGLSLDLPNWLQRHESRGNYVPFSGPGVWLTVERYKISRDGPRTLEDAREGMDWGEYEGMEVSGDDTDWRTTAHDTEEDVIRQERVVNGARDALQVRWYSPWGNARLQELGALVIDSVRPTTSLDEVLLQQPDEPTPDPLVDAEGWFSTPLPPDYTTVARAQIETVLHKPDAFFRGLTIEYRPSAVPLTIEAALDDEFLNFEISNTGGDAEEFWYNGANDTWAAYRHFFVGESGYVSVSVIYYSDDPDQRDEVERNLEVVLEGIRIAPLDEPS